MGSPFILRKDLYRFLEDYPIVIKTKMIYHLQTTIHVEITILKILRVESRKDFTHIY